MSTSKRQNGLHVSILQMVDRHGTVTRRQIADAFGISLSAVGRATGDLVGCGLLEEENSVEPTPGRPPRLIRLVPSAAYAVGLSLGSDWLTAAVVDLRGHALTWERRPMRITTVRAELLDQILETISAVVDRSQVDSRLVLGFGVGLHAPVDTGTGVCAGWPNTPEWSGMWQRLPLRDELVSHLGPYVFVGNANHYAALAEYRYGAAQGQDNFLYVNIGVGVGGAVVLDGNLCSGSRGVAGEIGHITVDERGPRCNCGNIGCLETMTSIPAVLRHARSRLEAGRESQLRQMCDGDWNRLTLPMIIQAANDGDKFCYEVLNRCGEYAGIGIASALNILGVELVTVRSDALSGQNIVLSAIQRVVILRGLPLITPHVRIVPAMLGDKGPPLGAASHVISRSFAPSGRIANHL